MYSSQNILVNVDDTEATNHVVNYVATLIGGKEEFYIHLLHILLLPLELVGFSGIGDLFLEQRKVRETSTVQNLWMEKIEKTVPPVFNNARSILQAAGISNQRVQTHFDLASRESDIATHILEAARIYECGTIVVGRRPFSRWKELFSPQVGDEVVRRGTGLAIWVIE